MPGESHRANKIVGNPKQDPMREGCFQEARKSFEKLRPNTGKAASLETCWPERGKDFMGKDGGKWGVADRSIIVAQPVKRKKAPRGEGKKRWKKGTPKRGQEKRFSQPPLICRNTP